MGLRYGLRRGLTAWAAWVNAARSRSRTHVRTVVRRGRCRPRRRVRRHALMVCSRSTTATDGASSATCRMPWSSRQEESVGTVESAGSGGRCGGEVFEAELELGVGPIGDVGARPAGADLRGRLIWPGGWRGQDGGVQCVDGVGGADSPVGSVQVATPSEPRVTCQPRRCLTRWWRRHRHIRLSSLVRPAGHGRTWSRSQNTAATVQPGNRQRRSLARIRFAIRADGRYGSPPTSESATVEDVAGCSAPDPGSPSADAPVMTVLVLGSRGHHGLGLRRAAVGVPWRHCRAWRAGSRVEAGVGQASSLKQRTGHRVAGRDLGRGGRCRVGEPPTGHQRRQTGGGPGDLDQVALADSGSQRAAGSGAAAACPVTSTRSPLPMAVGRSRAAGPDTAAARSGVPGDARAAVVSASAGTVTVSTVVMVALPATRSVSALARARSIVPHSPVGRRTGGPGRRSRPTPGRPPRRGKCRPTGRRPVRRPTGAARTRPGPGRRAGAAGRG